MPSNEEIRAGAEAIRTLEWAASCSPNFTSVYGSEQGEAWATERARVVLSAAEKEREGDVIEKLREWVMHHHGIGGYVSVNRLCDLLNELESTQGEKR